MSRSPVPSRRDPLEWLPPELASTVFKRLFSEPARFDGSFTPHPLYSCCAVSRAWRDIATHQELWRALYIKRYGALPPNARDAIVLYMRRAGYSRCEFTPWCDQYHVLLEVLTGDSERAAARSRGSGGGGGGSSSDGGVTIAHGAFGGCRTRSFCLPLTAGRLGASGETLTWVLPNCELSRPGVPGRERFSAHLYRECDEALCALTPALHERAHQGAATHPLEGAALNYRILAHVPRFELDDDFEWVLAERINRTGGGVGGPTGAPMRLYTEVVLRVHGEAAGDEGREGEGASGEGGAGGGDEGGDGGGGGSGAAIVGEAGVPPVLSPLRRRAGRGAAAPTYTAEVSLSLTYKAAGGDPTECRLKVSQWRAAMPFLSGLSGFDSAARAVPRGEQAYDFSDHSDDDLDESDISENDGGDDDDDDDDDDGGDDGEDGDGGGDDEAGDEEEGEEV